MFHWIDAEGVSTGFSSPFFFFFFPLCRRDERCLRCHSDRWYTNIELFRPLGWLKIAGSKCGNRRVNRISSMRKFITDRHFGFHFLDCSFLFIEHFYLLNFYSTIVKIVRYDMYYILMLQIYFPYDYCFFDNFGDILVIWFKKNQFFSFSYIFSKYHVLSKMSM